MGRPRSKPEPVAPQSASGLLEERLANDVRNPQRRHELRGRIKVAKVQEKSRRRRQRQETAKELGDQAPKPEVPKTLENQRVADTTTVAADDEEVWEDEDADELAPYFKREYAPRVVITTSDKARKRSITFCRQLAQLVPNAIYLKRCSADVKKMIPQAIEKSVSDLIIVNEDRGVPNSMLITHLPDGPTARFKLSSLKLMKEIKNVGEMTDHHPEIILSNFSTRLGHTIARMFASLFPQDPNFFGRRAVTFRNQRDFIFIRNHRYIFRSGEKVGLQELGPRFTLKLLSLQKGSFDSKFGDYVWVWKRNEMETSRRRFYI